MAALLGSIESLELRKEALAALADLRATKFATEVAVLVAERSAAKAKKVKLKRSLLVQEIIDAHPGPDAKTKRPALDDRRSLSAFIQAKLRK